MIVLVEADRSVHVHDVENLRALSVRTVHDAGAAGQALQAAGLGRPADDADDADGGHVWLRVDKLHALARPAEAALSWDAAWEAMLAFAGTHGWISGDGHYVRAHVESATG